MVNLNIPRKDNPEFKLQIEYGETTIIIGANGSGKTRLAVYLEDQLGEKAHRIAAHRALNLNPNIEKIPEAKAKQGLIYGNPDWAKNISQRKSARWNDKSSTYLLNDFDCLLQYLFAQQNNLAVENNQKFNKGEEITNSKTKLDILQEVWERLLPRKKLYITADDIRVSSTNIESTDYSASEMSDGERAIFYILGQVLSANEGSVLIFDEPELHIHKSIISNLWDEIEKLRPDCSFLIITHDIEFAATRVTKKYIIRNYYSEPAWDISEIPESDFDEQTISLILGSRKPILFVEGGKSSLDIETYRCCYPEWIIIPKGSCKAVIDAVSSLQKLNKDMPLLNIKCAGIVDQDTRSNSEIDNLRSLNIEVLSVSEIENLFSLPDVANEILKIEGYSGTELGAKLEEFRTNLINHIKSNLSSDDNLNKAIMKKVQRNIDGYLKKIDLSSSSNTESMKKEISKKVKTLFESKIDEWISEIRDKLNECFKNKDLDGLLQIYENKGLLSQTASLLKDTRRKKFEEWLMRQLKTKDSELLKELKNNLPTIEIS
ncbi:AAA family ATPase [uncultured Cardiobacterium sp.]|uniref:AAA family ATPase n=1 Tax=uncultured Cardiobacterium sp. TaxID=417619 RepID=UPI00260E84E7|nr:AAA family ATPase [uncultured Cardiobacterium sp.]